MCLLFGASLFAAHPALAQVIYVDGTLGDDTYNGASATVGANPIGPKRTIAAGVTAVAAGGTVRVAAGTYTLAATVDLSKALTLIGQDTITSTNTDGRVIVTSSGDLNLLQVSATNVTIKGLDLRVKSSGNTSISAGSNTEESAIVLATFPYNTKIICCRIVSGGPAPSIFNPSNGTGIRALTGSNQLLVRNCFIGSADTTNPASAGVLSRCIWQENGQGTISANRIYYGGFQDVIVRFGNQTTFSLIGNVIMGSGTEINSNNNNVYITANTFNSPASQDPPNGALVVKGSILKPFYIDGNRFNRYATPALQLYGVPTASVTNNRFFPKQTSTYTHVRATTCNNPNTCTLNVNSTLSFSGNRFLNGAAGQGTAIQLIRQDATTTYTLPTFGTAASPNIFSSTISKILILDATSGLEVANNINATQNSFYFGVDTVAATDLSTAQMITIEKAIDHYMDNTATGFVTIQPGTAVVSASGTNLTLQRAVDKAGAGGTTIAAGPYSYANLSNTLGGTLITTDSISVATWTYAPTSPYTLLGQVKVRTSLSLAGRYLNAPSPSCVFLAVSAPSALTVGTGAVIDGKFGRNVATSNTYVWPIGVGSQPRYATIALNSVSGLGRIYGQATTTDPYTLPPGTFTTATLNQIAFDSLAPNQGTWFFSTPTGTANYNLSLRVRDLPPADAYALVQHTGTNAFAFTGTPTLAGASTQWVFTSDSTVRTTGLTTFSDFAIAYGDSITPVPLRILAFTAKRVNNHQAAVNWRVRDGFEAAAYRLSVYEDNTWKIAGTIPSLTSRSVYNLTTDVSADASALRIQALDASGRMLDQSIATLAPDGKAAPPVAAGGINAITVIPHDFEGTLTIVDIAGHSIYSLPIADRTPSYQISMQRGVYLVRMEGNGRRYSYKVAVW